RAPQAASRRGRRGDHRRRTHHPAERRVSLRVRARTDDAGRRPLRVRSHAREDRPDPGEAPVTEKILTRNFDRADSHTLAVYRETGGYTPRAQATSTGPP